MTHSVVLEGDRRLNKHHTKNGLRRVDKSCGVRRVTEIGTENVTEIFALLQVYKMSL